MTEFDSLPTQRRARRWAAQTKERSGTVFFCHGLGLHSGCFETLLPMVTSTGHDLISHDALGHGDSKMPLDSNTIERIAEATIEVYERVAHEQPVLLGVGIFGGFMMRRIIEWAKRSDWVPPAIFYSVEYVNVPAWALRAIQRPHLRHFLDRFQTSYDYRTLTHDPDEDERYIHDDPRIRVEFPLGVSLQLVHETNRFFELREGSDSPHAFIIGTDDAISHLPALYKAGNRQRDYRLYEVEGGRTHMHRDLPEVREAFAKALADALAFVRTEAGLDPGAAPT